MRVLGSGVGSMLGTLLALVLTARSRSHLLATLRTLGMHRRQVGAVAALELTPLVVAVVVSGWVVGAVLPYLLVPAIDLTAFTGGPAAPHTRLDLARAGALGIGMVLVVAVAIAVATAVERHRRPVPAGTNGGDE
jgi:putative ABC transport system permease protein